MVSCLDTPDLKVFHAACLSPAASKQVWRHELLFIRVVVNSQAGRKKTGTRTPSYKERSSNRVRRNTVPVESDVQVPVIPAVKAEDSANAI